MEAYSKEAKGEIDKAVKATADEKPIFVMRHGKTALDALKRSDGWLDFPLTDEGRRDLIPAQQYLKDLSPPLACIYAPDLKRTMETAHIIASGMGVKPPKIIASDEAKTWNLGKEIIGGKKKENRALVRYYMANPTKVPEGGESMATFNKRFLTWFKEQLTEEREGPNLLVLSGSNIREISQFLTGDREILDLDEGGLMKLKPVGKMWAGSCILGGKHESDSEGEPTAWGS